MIHTFFQIALTVKDNSIYTFCQQVKLQLMYHIIILSKLCAHSSTTLPNKDIIATIEDAVNNLEKEETDTIRDKISLTL